MRRSHCLMLVLACALLSPPSASAQVVPPGYRVETFATGLDAPCAFEFMPDGGVLFTEQNTGTVRLVFAGGGAQSAPVIAIAGVATGGERGLLGIALDPQFPSRPYLYVLHSASAPSRTRIARYTLNADAHAGGADLAADAASRLDLLDAIPDAASNHNGGTLRFASDGTLIASLGDDAVPCGAQDSTGLRGVILRMAVNTLGNGPGVASIAQLAPLDNPYAASPDSNARLVLARGLRNPFRVQADPSLPWVMIGDVGDTQREEFDLLALPSAITLPFGMARAGANFGWPYREGVVAGSRAGGCPPAPAALAGPAFDYDRTSFSSGAAIIAAGYVPSIVTVSIGIQPAPSLPAGMYFSDYYTGALTRLDIPAGGAAWEIAPAVPGQPSAEHFAEGFKAVADWRVRGTELWFVRQSVNFVANTGAIGRLAADALPPPPPPSPPTRPRLVMLGMPALGQAEFLVVDDSTPPLRLDILDARGRQLRHYDTGAFGRAPEGLRLTWDGLDDDGAKAGPGVYWARLTTGGGSRTARVVLLR
ncbi:MAG: PQQ-dependent sugar dehydrogenase [Candidatus Eisenbacteria bacterium]